MTGRFSWIVRIVGCLAVALLGLASTASPGSSEDSGEPATPRVVAQFGVGNLLGAGKDFAVKSALSAFGKSLGDQLPIVVAPADAFPTTPTLPGPPFAPAGTANIAVPLRESRDGTVALPPGDFAFPVGVFCMRATSGSPSGHRYLVAPLHGSAADIITALNSRAPSYAVDHHVLQVLSWDIQAGMAYDAMQRDQRAAVDRIIPDYRGRLNGDVYERIRDQYEKVAQNVPGMPSFEGALTRVGPVGAQVVAMQNLRQELAQPPPTFEQLARELVPLLPPERTASDPTGATPWSRYSERVFVRFVTAGNYATPGTYQVRVVPPAGSASSSGAVAPAGALAPNLAGVPFTNIVNNPGNDAVQPLTQTPNAGPGPAGPAPRPSPTPKILSVTAATIPANRARTLVGVGEIITLTFTGGSALWHINGLGGMLQSIGPDTALYRAAPVAAYETITATGAHGSATIDFQVIPPAGIVDRRVDGTLDMHHKGRPESGFHVHTYIRPDTVSFQFIDVIERDIGGIGTGVYAPLNGYGHDPLDVFLPVGHVVPGLGSVEQSVDEVYSGDPCTPPPFRPGSLIFHIPTEYRLRGTAQSYLFATVEQLHELQPDGNNLESRKGGTWINGQVSDPTTYAGKTCYISPKTPPSKKAKR